MTTPLTSEELVEIEARAKEATPGPWGYTEDGSLVSEVMGERMDLLHALPVPRDPQLSGDRKLDFTEAKRNATFCAYARADIPRLLATARAHEQRADNAENILDVAREQEREIRGITQAGPEEITAIAVRRVLREKEERIDKLQHQLFAAEQRVAAAMRSSR